MCHVNLIFFAEDPGSANYISHLPGVCKKKGYSSVILCEGKAIEVFTKNGEPYIHAKKFSSAEEVIDTYSPEIIITGTSENPDTFGFDLISRAHHLQKTTIGVIDSHINADYRFRGRTQNPLAHAPKWLFVPDSWTKKAFSSFGFCPESIIICGHPQYDYVKKMADTFMENGMGIYREKWFPKAPVESKIVIFAAEISGGLNPKQFLRNDSYTLSGRGKSHNRTDIVVEEFLDAMAKIPDKPYLVLRLHPKNTPDEFKAYIKEFDVVSQDEPVLEIIAASDLFVGMTSMILLEAAIMGKPTFSIVPRDLERDWLPTVGAGITQCASTRRELNGKLHDYLKTKTSPPLKGLLKFGAKESVANMIDKIALKET